MCFLSGMNTKKIELLAPAGSMANLKAAVSKGADAVYLGMKRFSARDYATNFNEQYLKEAIKACKSNNVKVYLAMNTLVKNNEIQDFFNQLSLAYSAGIDAVIIQEISFLDIIKKYYPDLKVHISTQAGVMNSAHANLLSKADRITLARELTKEEIKNIRNNFSEELEIFCHGALCVSVSGSCLFSSLLGGRSGNRGKCAQPCRKRYNDQYYLSTKELCLVKQIPAIIQLGVDAVKIEGRMRTPYYTATVTEVYKKAIDSFYNGDFKVSKEMLASLEGAFSREFTAGWFNSQDVFNRDKSTGEIKSKMREFYEVQKRSFDIKRNRVNVQLPEIKENENGVKQLLVRVYNKKDAFEAASNGADIIYFDLFDEHFVDLKDSLHCKLFGVTPRIMVGNDTPNITKTLREKKPDGILAGNLGILNYNLKFPIHLDYNINCFNGIDLGYFLGMNCLPIISPELSIKELRQFRNKNFIAMVHGKIRFMTLRHKLPGGWLKDEKGGLFRVNSIMNGSEILNGKELGLLSKSSQLLEHGVASFFVDTERDVGGVVRLYRKILDGKEVNDSWIKRNYILGWSYRGVA